MADQSLPANSTVTANSAGKFPSSINSFLIGFTLGHSDFGSSTVVLARRCDVADDTKLYAIKRTEIEKLTSKDLQLLQHEMELSSKLNHPNLCKFLSSFVVENGFIFTVYPLYNYGSCHDIIATEFKHGLPVTVVGIVLRNILLALQYLHRFGIIHRAVKASHILLDSSGNVSLAGLRYSLNLPVVWDVAHDYPEHGLHMLAWIAPEILQQNLSGYTASSDIYSLGITAVELVTGTIPYNKLRPTEILLQKIKGVVPQLPDSTTIDEMHCDFSASQTSLDGLEQTNDMMSAPNLQSISSNMKRIRSLQQFVDICVQTEPNLRPTTSQLKSSTYIRHIKRKLREKEGPNLLDLLKGVNPITEFIPTKRAHVSEMELVLEKVPSVSLDDDDCDGWVF